MCVLLKGKYVGHFIAKCLAELVAQVFFAVIISDRDTVFTSIFWRELVHLTGTKLNMTSALSNGQIEAANKVIVMYRRCLTGDRPRQWLRWLPWVEYIYNTAFQSALKKTPFKIVYGRDPPTIRPYEPGETRVVALAKNMADRDERLADFRARLEQA
ncbi:unnamed protein product [Urochloa humidicola]